MSALIADAAGKCSARIHAYCYMTNHIHAVIQVGEISLGRVMLLVAGRYARIIQAKLETTGHLFENRYHSVLVDTDAYLVELLRYVHLNPVRAKLVQSADEYPWSSHHAYAGGACEPWLTTDFALSFFASRRGHAIKLYRNFVKEGEANPELESPLAECNANDARILGSDDFASRLLGPRWKPKSRKTLDQLIGEACDRFMVEEKLLGSPSRHAKLVEARAWIVTQAMEGRVASIAAVARRLNRDESSLRHAIKTRFPTG